jgi:hypothetical protein
MLFASIQTTWAWHYCGDILRYIALADGNPNCCCENKNKVECNNIEPHSSNLPQISKSCCSDYFVDVETDNFDLPNFTIETSQHVSNLFLLHDNSLIINVPENFSVLQYVFPPGGVVKHNADLLTLICIFRI